MARKRLGPTDPREWLNWARSNLARARRVMPGVYLEDLCFDAQQCAEKAIKAMFLHHGFTFPYVHDLTHLLGLLEGNGVKIPKYVKKASALTGFAVEARYPGLSGPVNAKEYRRAIRIAEAVLAWSARPIEGKSPRSVTAKRRKKRT
jgi:HEPN domain-containing protein